MDRNSRYYSGAYSPSGSNHYPDSEYPHNHSPHFPYPPPPPGPPSSWADPHLHPAYPPPSPQTHYSPTQSIPVGWPPSASFPQSLYPYPLHENIHYDSSYYQYHHQTSDSYTQFGHSSSILHSEIDHQSGSLPNYHSQSPHVKTDAPPSSSTSASLYPLNDLISGMRLSDCPRPLDSSLPEGSFHKPSVMPCQSYHSDSSSPSFSSNDGSFSGYPFQHGQHSIDSDDSICSDSSLALIASQDYEKLQCVPFGTSAMSLRVVLLHGTLDVWVYEAKNLPNRDLFSENLRQVITKTVARKLSDKIEEHISHQKPITSDPYVSVCLSSAVVARTRVISNDQDPVWTQHFSIPVAHNLADVLFVIKDNDFFGSQLIGTVAIPAERVISGQRIEDWYPVLGPNGKACNVGAALKLSIQFFPVEYQSLYRFGIGAGPDYVGVPNTYFPLRKGGKVTLYQDVHVPDYLLPAIKLDHQVMYKHGKCWQDICEAILQARRLIYIAGWSVNHKIKLVHGGSNPNLLPSDHRLGDLLKLKSQEGLRVLLLVWDDPTSVDILGFHKKGVMKTHDEEARRFFKHSNVQVLLCPRYADNKNSWVKQREVATIFTHHQKTVLVDSEAVGSIRKITAFLGGLDLCDGRYDTPEHHLFRTLGTVHKDDYRNRTFTEGIDFGGPREPWHDLYCKIDGPAAYDVLTNFEQRWTKAAERHGFKKLKGRNDDSLLKLDRLPEIIGISELNIFHDNDPETWHVQVFRSIDSGSVKGFPKDVKEAEARNLVSLKNLVVDMSIHTAYVKAIRSAQHFIYIENQYFIGSSYNWSAHKDIGANNMIPMELALKIAKKIKAHERFAVYVLIPMYPEGVSTSIPVQRILYWQVTGLRQRLLRFSYALQLAHVPELEPDVIPDI